MPLKEIGYGFYTKFDSIRHNVYLVDKTAYFIIDNKKYSFTLSDNHINNINNGQQIHITLTNQNYSDIDKNGLNIKPTITFI